MLAMSCLVLTHSHFHCYRSIAQHEQALALAPQTRHCPCPHAFPNHPGKKEPCLESQVQHHDQTVEGWIRIHECRRQTLVQASNHIRGIRCLEIVGRGGVSQALPGRAWEKRAYCEDQLIPLTDEPPGLVCLRRFTRGVNSEPFCKASTAGAATVSMPCKTEAHMNGGRTRPFLDQRRTLLREVVVDLEQSEVR